MSFVKNMKRAFGFGGYDADEEAYFEDRPSNVTNDKEPTPPVSTIQKPMASDELPLAIFDGVIAVFNEAQPDFIKSCLDIEAQRRYLYQSMDASLKEYLENLGDVTRQKALKSWADEKTKLQAQLHEMEELKHRAEESLAEQQQQKLSAQRQKRAFNDRIAELEKHIAELEAEREQYELETKSLMNKLKVADVKDSDLSTLRDEMIDLRNRLKQAEDDLAQRNAEFVQRDAYITDLEAKLKIADDKLQDSDNQLKAANDSRQTIADLEAKLQAAEAAAYPSADDLKAMDEINQRLMQFEDVKRKKDAQIEKQASQIAQLEDENIALKAQLQHAVVAKEAAEQQAKQAQQAQQQAQPAQTHLPDAEKPQRRRQRNNAEQPAKQHKAKISAIDESIDGIEWLLSTPGEDETVSKAVASSTSDNDFGYQPPVRKEIVIDDDAQLSLF